MPGEAHPLIVLAFLAAMFAAGMAGMLLIQRRRNRSGPRGVRWLPVRLSRLQPRKR